MTATKVTPVNYTETQVETMLAEYAAGISVEAIATSLGKSVRSVVAKLSREGVYKAKAKNTSGTVTLRKAQLIELIAAKVGATQESLESLEKATKEALEILASAI